MSEALYNKEILDLAKKLNPDDRLENPDASRQMDSPLCGSRIRVDIVLDGDGRIARYGQQVRACALGQSSAAIVRKHAVGRSLEDMREVRDQMEAMLKRDGEPPDGEWAELKILTPARAHKSRHASIMLPFKATVKAMEDLLESDLPKDAAGNGTDGGGEGEEGVAS